MVLIYRIRGSSQVGMPISALAYPKGESVFDVQVVLVLSHGIASLSLIPNLIITEANFAV